MPDVIMFCFGGRKPNLELQLPYIRRILAENPNVEYHLWDLARHPQDHEFIRTVKGERIRVRGEMYQPHRSWGGFNKVWRYYAQPEFRDTLFVKLDDDVVFLESQTFSSFLDTVRANPDVVVSAKTINNGASTALEPELWAGFESLNIPLLDVHLSAEYAERCHRWFFDNWRTTLSKPSQVVATEDWVSINCIGYDWNMGRQIAHRLDKPSPPMIAGRTFTPRNRVGDEGSVNILPRVIDPGFVVAHLYFGPQAKVMDGALLTELRKQYADIAAEYL